jgi:hypothetical protein
MSLVRGSLQVSRSLLCRRPEEREGNCVVEGAISREKHAMALQRQVYRRVQGFARLLFVMRPGNLTP